MRARTGYPIRTPGRALLGFTLASLALASASACGDEDHAPVSPPPPSRDGGPRMDLGTPPPDDDMGVPLDDMGGPPPDDDMGAPAEDMGGPPLDMGSIEDTGRPPPIDMGAPIDGGPHDAGPRTDASIGPIRRALLTHSCDATDGRQTLLLELSETPPGSCDPSTTPYLLFSIRSGLPVEAPETFTGGSTIFGALCSPDGTCTSGGATLSFDSYADLVSAAGSYVLELDSAAYSGDFAGATFCPSDFSPCGG